jgi:phosphonate transport system permease protein
MSDVGATPATAKTLKEAALADAGGLTLRYREAFRPNWRQRCVTIASVSVLTGLLIFGFTTLEISPSRIVQGFGRLGEFIALMLPPSFGTFERLETYLLPLAQTLAIAFLGTLLAAVLAAPFGFLAARNVFQIFSFISPFAAALM